MEFHPELLRSLRTCSNVAVLTGAGVSQESGLQTFRDPQEGLWAQYRPETLATPEAFEANPELVWEFYSARRLKNGAVHPNRWHFALSRMEGKVPRFTLVTQNVDGLHQRAGSKCVVELHGNIGRVKCSRGCGVVGKWEEFSWQSSNLSHLWGEPSSGCGLVRGKSPSQRIEVSNSGSANLRYLFCCWHVRTGPTCSLPPPDGPAGWSGHCGN